MNTKDTRGPQLERMPEIVLTRAPVEPVVDRPVVRTDPVPLPAAPARFRLRRAVQLGVALGLVLAVAGGGWLALRGDGDDGADVVATDRGAPLAEPAGPAPLTLAVDVPAVVQAGTAVQLTVSYEDGDGIFSGSTEDWGDGVGTSSLAQGRCAAAGTAAAPASGSYVATHTWSEPGSYTVTVGVSSYTCVDGAPVEEQATTTVRVEVAAR
jgi:hypothetical protein